MNTAPPIGVDEKTIYNFLVQEVTLLDERRFEEWMDLFPETIGYRFASALVKQPTRRAVRIRSIFAPTPAWPFRRAGWGGNKAMPKGGVLRSGGGSVAVSA